jgi:hypothetical protein
MNFHSVYKTGAAACGAAGEDDCVLENDAEEVFFPMQNHRHCINVHEADAENADARTWCYVAKACHSLNNGGPVNAQVSKKICTESDHRLRNLTVRELFKLLPYGDKQKTVNWAYAIADPTGPCKIGKSNDEAVTIVNCGKEKWAIDEESANCKQGCATPEAIHKVAKLPAVEAWMYGPKGPPPLDGAKTHAQMLEKFPDGIPKIYTQTNKNTVEITTEWD